MKPNPYDASIKQYGTGMVGVRGTKVDQWQAEIRRLRRERDEARGWGRELNDLYASANSRLRIERDEALEKIRQLEEHRDVLSTADMNNSLVCDGLKWQRDEARRWAKYYCALYIPQAHNERVCPWCASRYLMLMEDNHGNTVGLCCHSCDYVWSSRYTCNDCGAEPQEVRPGKWQCPECEGGEQWMRF